MRVSDEGLGYLAFYVWNECPFIVQMDLLIIKYLISAKKVTFGLIKFCYEMEEVHSKRESLEIMHQRPKSCFI